MTKRNSLRQMQLGTYERSLVKRAHKRELSHRTGASGDVMDFALLVADEVICAEMDRVQPALKAALAFLSGFDDNEHAPETIRLLRQALRRPKSKD